MDKSLSVAIIALAMSLVSLSIGLIFKSALDGISRNPSAESSIGKYVFVGAGLAEALGLFAFIMGLLILFG